MSRSSRLCSRLFLCFRSNWVLMILTLINLPQDLFCSDVQSLSSIFTVQTQEEEDFTKWWTAPLTCWWIQFKLQRETGTSLRESDPSWSFSSDQPSFCSKQHSCHLHYPHPLPPDGGRGWCWGLWDSGGLVTMLKPDQVSPSNQHKVHSVRQDDVQLTWSLTGEEQLRNTRRGRGEGAGGEVERKRRRRRRQRVWSRKKTKHLKLNVVKETVHAFNKSCCLSLLPRVYVQQQVLDPGSQPHHSLTTAFMSLCVNKPWILHRTFSLHTEVQPVLLTNLTWFDSSQLDLTWVHMTQFNWTWLNNWTWLSLVAAGTGFLYLFSTRWSEACILDLSQLNLTQLDLTQQSRFNFNCLNLTCLNLTYLDWAKPDSFRPWLLTARPDLFDLPLDGLFLPWTVLARLALTLLNSTCLGSTGFNWTCLNVTRLDF